MTTSKEYKQKIEEKQAKREHLVNVFMMQFAYGFIFSFLLMCLMSFKSGYSSAYDATMKFLPYVFLGLGAALFIVYKFLLDKIIKTDLVLKARLNLLFKWLSHGFFIFGIILGIIFMHINLPTWLNNMQDSWFTRGVFPIQNFMKWGLIQYAYYWAFAWVGVYVLVCLTLYIIKYRKIDKKKKAKEGGKAGKV